MNFWCKVLYTSISKSAIISLLSRRQRQFLVVILYHVCYCIYKIYAAALRLTIRKHCQPTNDIIEKRMTFAWNENVIYTIENRTNILYDIIAYTYSWFILYATMNGPKSFSLRLILLMRFTKKNWSNNIALVKRNILPKIYTISYVKNFL